MTFDDTVGTAAAAHALALAGDLAMGQPPGHSARTARLAARIATAAGADTEASATARAVALLRWSGCNASAAGFARLMGDDIAARHALLTRTLPAGHPLTYANLAPLVRTQCEVAGDVARLLHLPPAVEQALRHAGEHANGRGMPDRLPADAIPAAVFHVALAGDLEVLARAHGHEHAAHLIAQRAGRKYPADLVELVLPHGRQWLADADADAAADGYPFGEARTRLALVADVVELRLPALAGHARRVAHLAHAAATLAGLPAAERLALGRAALLHGFGRAAVPNTVWQRTGKLRSADWDKARRVPYWTARLAAHVPALADEAHCAALAYERLDGSGYYRGLAGAELTFGHRLLQAAVAWTALRSPRPWRPAYPPAAATALLAAQAKRLDPHAVDAVIAAGNARPFVAHGTTLLSARETEVLRLIGTGAGIRATARALRIGTGAVRTHIAAIYERLGCTTRAGATLRAVTMGVI